MSGDHNQNQSDSGWRKRQIALDIKADNARELGLDYEPSTIVEMARRAGAVFPADGSYHSFERHEDLVAFAHLVAQQEREACAKVCDDAPEPDGRDLAERIRARGQA
jgi:hypothetical protein